jgi:two-component system response regulator HydG
VAHVLVADDDDSIRETLRTLLEDEGHRVTEAITGQATLNALRAESAGCVVLLDLVMPDLDGVAFLRAVQLDSALAQRHVYVVLSASNEERLNAVQPLIAALDGYLLRKPFDIDEVTSIVAKAAQRLEAHAN